MSTGFLTRAPSHLSIPRSSFISSGLTSPRSLSVFSPAQTSFPSPRTPPLSPTSSGIPLDRKRPRLPTPDSPTYPSTPPSKRVRCGVNLMSGETMEGQLEFPKGAMGTDEPLGSDISTPFSAGGEVRSKRKMRLSLLTDLTTPPLMPSDQLATPLPTDIPASPSSLPSPRSSSSRQSSPPNLTKIANMKRNPKRLSLAIPTQEAGPSTVAVRRSLTPPSDNDSTPFTPGPPRTPSATMTLGRLTKARRPNLLSLLTQPTSTYDVPPTPGFSHPYATSSIPRRRSNTTEDPPAVGIDPRSSRSAYPRLSTAFAPIIEGGPRVASPVPTASSRSDSVTSTASSSPSLPQLDVPRPSRGDEPYADGPIEIVPGVYLGAEDTMYHWSSWARSKRVRILNVAQEIDDPFAADGVVPVSRKGKGKVNRAVYPADASEGRPEVEYTHLAWSHGESGLAELDSEMKLEDVIQGRFTEEEVEEREKWRFWEAIRYMEQGRQRGEAVLIHCQCGVSRSATLVIAYTMALAASGQMPGYLGHLKGMQDSYDFIKAKSCWIGPNVSLVFQLVEFARNLTTLLSAHHIAHPGSASQIQTSFPSAEEVSQSESDWARQRAQFDDDNYSTPTLASDPTMASPSTFGDGSGYVMLTATASKLRAGMRDMSLDEEDMRREASQLDEAMRVRRMGRV